jgi:prepilin-type N-terminal cleavage/methylation domain-containing protein
LIAKAKILNKLWTHCYEITMKNLFTLLLKRESGFTLVELMVVVAIIGLLSAVAVPNFKKYQAKSKIAEAKIQLSAAYIAEQAFFSDFNMYAGCLKYMGFDPESAKSSRYYAVGFPNRVGQLDLNAFDSAVNTGLDATNCPRASADSGRDYATPGTTYYLAGKGVGGQIIDQHAKFAGPNAGAPGNCTLNPPPENGSCVGPQRDTETMTFQLAAVGVISGDFTDPDFCSGINLNNQKRFWVLRQGY